MKLIINEESKSKTIDPKPGDIFETSRGTIFLTIGTNAVVLTGYSQFFIHWLKDINLTGARFLNSVTIERGGE